MNEEERLSEHGQKLFQDGLECMKIATKQYARRQNKMTKNRFLGHPQRQVPPIYRLDTSDISQWTINVSNKAITVIDSFIHNVKCPIESEALFTGPNYEDGVNPHITHKCEICDRVFIGDLQYNIHLKSNRHKKMKNRREKLNITSNTNHSIDKNLNRSSSL